MRGRRPDRKTLRRDVSRLGSRAETRYPSPFAKTWWSKIKRSWHREDQSNYGGSIGNPGERFRWTFNPRFSTGRNSGSIAATCALCTRREHLARPKWVSECWPASSSNWNPAERSELAQRSHNECRSSGSNWTSVAVRPDQLSAGVQDLCRILSGL